MEVLVRTFGLFIPPNSAGRPEEINPGNDSRLGIWAPAQRLEDLAGPGAPRLTQRKGTAALGWLCPAAEVRQHLPATPP